MCTSSRGPLISESAPAPSESSSKKEITITTARVGKPAPDCEAPAFIGGKGFKNVKLSDYRGQWVVLCFYPGDFTFV